MTAPGACRGILGDGAALGRGIGPLILSIFPGVDLLGRAFEQEWPEACVVRGPDLLWGGDIRTFHPPSGKFDGVIGGPPCQVHSVLQHALPKRQAENLIPEFARVVEVARPRWWVMENVIQAPPPFRGAEKLVLNNRWLGEDQNRVRVFYSNLMLRPHVETEALESPVFEYAVIGGDGGRNHGGYKWGKGTQVIPRMCVLQGLEADFFAGSPLTVKAQRHVLGNGVPMAMGRAIARAVRRAVEGRP